MGKIVSCFLVVFIIGSQKAQYNFTVSNQTYSDLLSPIILSNSGWSYATSFSINLNFTFNYQGTNFSKINVEGGGFTYFDPSYNNLFLPFGCRLKAKAVGNSPISYLETGVAPNRIMKIEWKNAEYFYELNSTANFQLWLYESSNIIEVHTGNSAVTNATIAYQGNGNSGPAIGAYKFVAINNCEYGIGLTGTAISPTVNNGLSGNIGVFSYALNETPATDLVYTFFITGTGIEKHGSIEKIKMFSDKNKIYVESELKNLNLTIYDLNGKQVLSKIVESDFVNCHELSSNLYLAKLTDSNNQIIKTQKIIIN